MYSATAPYPPRAILEGVPRVGYDIHLCPFPGSLYACLQYLGDPRDYDYLMGVTGAPFRRLWNRDDGGNVDLSYFGDEPFRRVFEGPGLRLESGPSREGGDDPGHHGKHRAPAAGHLFWHHRAAGSGDRGRL